MAHRSNHLLDIEGSGKEGKVHVDLVLTEVAEPFVLHVVFHLPEDGLWLYWAVGSVLESFLRGEPVPCLLLVAHELVVGLDGSCRLFALVATPPQGTALAVLGPVDTRECPVAAFGLGMRSADTPLSCGTNRRCSCSRR